MTSTKLLTDPENIRQSKQDLDNALEAHSAELRQPKWNYWRQIVKVELWQAIALSFGFEPDLVDRFIDVGYLSCDQSSRNRISFGRRALRH